MVKLTLDVDVVVCATEIIAEPGDRLMITNGMCLGRYTDPALDHSAPGRPSRSQPSSENQEVNNGSIIGVLTGIPTTVMDICDALNIPRKDSKLRASIGSRIERLHRSGFVQMTPRPEGSTTRHYGKYYLESRGMGGV